PIAAADVEPAANPAVIFRRPRLGEREDRVPIAIDEHILRRAEAEPRGPRVRDRGPDDELPQWNALRDLAHERRAREAGRSFEPVPDNAQRQEQDAERRAQDRLADRLV